MAILQMMASFEDCRRIVDPSGHNWWLDPRGVDNYAHTYAMIGVGLLMLVIYFREGRGR